MPTLPQPLFPASVPTVLLAAALALGLSGCVGDGGDDHAQDELTALRADLDALAEREQVQQERLAALEQVAQQLERQDPLARITATDDELERLVDAMSVLEEELAATVSDGARNAEQATAASAELRAENAELRDALEEVRTQVSTARSRAESVGADVEELRTLYTTLRDRLDRLQRGGG